MSSYVDISLIVDGLTLTGPAPLASVLIDIYHPCAAQKAFRLWPL